MAIEHTFIFNFLFRKDIFIEKISNSTDKYQIVIMYKDRTLLLMIDMKLIYYILTSFTQNLSIP